MSADFVIPVSGGVASFAEGCSPFNKVAGLGFENVLGLPASRRHLSGSRHRGSRSFPREVIARAERDFAAAGVIRYAALRDGVIAGGASFRTAGGIAQLPGGEQRRS